MDDSKSLKRILEETADGSHTLFVPELNEHYHSVNGAIQESRHVFIQAGLNQCSKNKINVFEVGLGTGLNALLTAKYAMQCNKVIHYTSVEAFPLSLDIVAQLNYAKSENVVLFQKIHQVEWGAKVQISDCFFLTKLEADFIQFDFTPYYNSFDVIYFDAFAPDVQEGMWGQDILNAMFGICKQDAILTTYCAKGVVRRRMQAAGFRVERIPGPPGKREMLRARKENL